MPDTYSASSKTHYFDISRATIVKFFNSTPLLPLHYAIFQNFNFIVKCSALYIHSHGSDLHFIPIMWLFSTKKQKKKIEKRDFLIFRPFLNPVWQPLGSTLDPTDWHIRIHRKKCYRMVSVLAIDLFEKKFTKVLQFWAFIVLEGSSCQSACRLRIWETGIHSSTVGTSPKFQHSCVPNWGLTGAYFESPS